MIYVPGTFVTFKGKSLSIDVISIAAPLITASDVEIDQYTQFNPFLYASAYDIVDKNLTNKIIVDKNTVKTKIPGVYDTCYSVSNSKSRTTKLCIKVTVKKIKTRFRYINNDSLSNAKLVLWKETHLYNFLYKALLK